MTIKDGIQHETGEIRSFLMIGQSNMAGSGDFGEVPTMREFGKRYSEVYRELTVGKTSEGGIRYE